MPTFIELHNNKGNPVYVNIDKISMFYPSYDRGSIVWCEGAEDSLFTESIAEIISILKKVGEHNV